MANGLRSAVRSVLGVGASGIGLFIAGEVLAAEDQPALEEVVVVGTRTAGQSVDESLAPIDLVPQESLRRAAAIPGEIGAAIQSLVPSFNLPRQSNSNFADLVRPAQLRNLSPDQVLVLVNGKRRHTTATLTTESKLGKGTSPVDFNSIPVGAIKRIEVLRDGAGAQYGSDAIAGVINVVLKDAAEGGEATASWGQNRTDFEPTGRSVNDGDTLFASLNAGFGVGDGFLNLTAEYRDRDQTLRSGPDQIPFLREPDAAQPRARRHADPQGGRRADGRHVVHVQLRRSRSGDALELYSFGSYSRPQRRGRELLPLPGFVRERADDLPRRLHPGPRGGQRGPVAGCRLARNARIGLELGPVGRLRLERLRPRHHELAQRVVRRREPDAASTSASTSYRS